MKSLGKPVRGADVVQICMRQDQRIQVRVLEVRERGDEGPGRERIILGVVGASSGVDKRDATFGPLDDERITMAPLSALMRSPEGGGGRVKMSTEAQSGAVPSRAPPTNQREHAEATQDP